MEKRAKWGERDEDGESWGELVEDGENQWHNLESKFGSAK